MQDSGALQVKSSAVTEEQYIYIQAVSGTNSVNGTTEWIGESDESVSSTVPAATGLTPHWSTKRPTYQKNYPVIFVAKQRKTVDDNVTCSTPTKDDTITVIDGGHITTGSIDANLITSGSINANLITSGTFTIPDPEDPDGNPLFQAGQGAVTIKALNKLGMYFEFDDNGIVIGKKSTSETTEEEANKQIKLLIKNDKMSFFQGDNPDNEVAFISANKLYITDANIVNSLAIGNFAFIPQNNGNLSFKKVVNNNT